MLEPQDAIAHAEDVWSRACRRAAKRVAEEACRQVVLGACRKGKEPQPSEPTVLEEVLGSTVKVKQESVVVGGTEVLSWCM
jgi:hypothetical protein